MSWSQPFHSLMMKLNSREGSSHPHVSGAVQKPALSLLPLSQILLLLNYDQVSSSRKPALSCPSIL